jgi:hypothetical protein
VGETADRPAGVARWSGVMLSVLRIVSAFIYLQHGVQKQFGWLQGAG